MAVQGELTAVFRSHEQADAALTSLRSLGLGDDAVQMEEKKGGLLESLLPEDQRSDETRVTVRAGDRSAQVRQVLQQHGAEQIEGGEPTPAPSADGQTLPLAQEELVPAVSVVQVGEVVVRKVVVTEMRTIEVPIRREEIVVERSILNQPLAAPAGNRFERPATTESGEVEQTELGADEEVIRIPILEEQVTVEKHPIVREEVRILKRRVQDAVQLSEPVRREEPVVEQTTTQTDGGVSVPREIMDDSGVTDEPRQYQ